MKLGAGEIGIFILMNFVSTIKDIVHHISRWVFTWNVPLRVCFFFFLGMCVVERKKRKKEKKEIDLCSSINMCWMVWGRDQRAARSE